jgi:outer membrane receptor for ferrienterochelin and colicins
MTMNRKVLRKPTRPAVVLRTLIALACVSAQLAPLRAYADGNADEADLHFETGAEAYSKGDFRTALEHFLASNRLVPNRNVIFNIARTYEQLKRFADAHRYYVDALQGETNPQTTATIQDAIKRIAPNVAVLKIESDPPGATVYIDRKDLGSRGRAPRPLAIAEGKYKVIVELDGYEPASADGIQTKIGSETAVPFKLKRIVGTVAVTVEGAPNAEVHLDDETAPPVCSAPCTFDAPPGTHLVYFSRTGFQAAPRQINVIPKETVKAAAVMTPLTGSLVVQADERDAIVEIDGKPSGFTPAVIQSVAVGSRKLRVTLRGYNPVEREVVIKANQQSQILDLKLVPLRQVAAASRFTENIEDAPSSVTVIDGQELRAMGYPTIADALRGVRGITSGYDRVYQSASIRGLGDPRDYGNRLLVLQDGTVMNDNILASSYIGSDGRADLGDVDRIEVVRGPGSLVYGTGAMSGVVNLVPKAKDDETSVHVGAGTYENSVFHGRGGFHVNFNKAKTAGMWASVSGARSNGVDLAVEPRDKEANGNEATAKQVDFFRSVGTAGRIWFGPVTAQWFYHTRQQHLPTGPYFTTFNDARNYYKDERFMAEVRAEPKISDKFEILARAHANRYTFHGGYFYDGDANFDEDYAGTWFGAEARAVIKPVSALRLTVGGEAQIHPEANMIGCGNYAGYENSCPPIELDATGTAVGDTYLDVKQNYYTGAIYGLADWGVAKWLRLSAGVRGDFSSLIGPQVVARGAIILKPWTGGVIKLMGGNAFRRPSLFERYYYDGGYAQLQAEDPTGQSQATHYVQGGLKAETIINGEVEITQRFLEDWTALGSLHLNRIENIVTSFEIDPATGAPAAGSGVVQYQNSPAPALNVGFDLEIRRDWRQGWMVSAFYTFQRPQFTGLDPDNPLVGAYPSLINNPRLINAPEHVAGMRGVVPVVADLASLGLRVSVEAPRRITYNDSGGQAEGSNLPEVETTRFAAVADLTLSGNVKKFGVGYVIGVYNIGDQRYSLPITETYFSRLSPQNGRTFLANVNITYP